MKQCGKCKYFYRLYINTKLGYGATKFGICEYKSKIKRSTYICNEYTEEGVKNEYK